MARSRHAGADGAIGTPTERLLRLENALDKMPQGFCMYDAEAKLVVCNRRYAEIFQLPPELAKPGTSLIDILRYRVRAGLTPAGDSEAYIRNRLDLATRKTPSTSLITLKNGRAYRIVHQPLAEGGWVATHEDVTEQTRTNQELADTRATLVEALDAAKAASERASVAHDRLRDAFEVVPEGLALFDAQDRYVVWNKRYEEIFANSFSGLKVGASFEDVLRLGLSVGQYPEAVGREESWLAERLAQHHAMQSDHEMQLPGGRWLRIQERRTADGGSVGIRIDITDLKRREASFRLLFDDNPLPMWVFDLDSLRFLAVNDAMIRHYGYSRERFLTMTVLEIRPEADRETFRRQVAVGELSFDRGWTRRHLKADGTEILVDVYSQPIRYEGCNGMIVATIDVTERKRAEEKVAHLAHHDPLTDLPNRTAFRDQLTVVLGNAGKTGDAFAVLCIDLDRFKEVNDVFGHAVGDLFLCEIARRMQTAAAGAFLARIGGDEFALIAARGQQPMAAAALADKLLAAVESGILVHGETINAGLSIGVATYPADGLDVATLMSNADAALYRAKAEGRGVTRFFEPDMDKRLRERRALQQDLRSAIERAELLLHYQPQVTIAGEVTGFEALARWRHPTRGMVPPHTFIPIAEESRLILLVGEWVLREACREAASWIRPLKVSVNISPVQFQAGDLVGLIHSALFQSGLPANRLELEITEGVLIGDPARALSILRRLKSMGLDIAMDDFGTGYSSMSYLQSFPFDRLKIDRTFITNVETNPQSAAIVRATLGLARGLHLPVIAEGVENARQLAFLANERCDQAQGYFIGKPLPIAEYSEIVNGGAALIPKAMQRLTRQSLG